MDKSREAAAKAMKDLQKRLSRFDRGFIIYTNAKNYTYNSDFEKRGGFSAGTPISLRKFDKVLSIMHVRNKRLINMAMQVIPGAIGEKDKKNISKNFSMLIAHALFDDVNEIGKKTESGV